MQYSLINHGDESSITVFIDGQVLVAHSDHPNWSEIVEAVVVSKSSLSAGSIIGLFDVTAAVAARFDPLSERVAVANGRIYFDGDEIDNALTKQVVRFLEEGVEDWLPLVNFFENVQQNPNEHSREQLYRWLERHEFTITDSGFIVGYKGCKRDEDGILRSLHSGPAIVNGEPFNGHVPNEIGSIIEIARSAVHHDPSVGCSTGLHVGTYEYALGYSTQGALLEVHVNPRDVVSVPTDCDHQKVRVCRYLVVDEIDAKYIQPVIFTYDEDESDFFDEWDEAESHNVFEDDGGFCPCGEREDECEDCYDDESQFEDFIEPTEGELEDLIALAKSRKRGPVRFAEARGWVLTGTDPTSPTSWTRPL